MSRYLDKRKLWLGEKKWSPMQDIVFEKEEIEKHPEVFTMDTSIEYKVRHIKITDWTPMYVQEAIEKMELMGFRQMLFKNAETGKCAMLYKRPDDTYALVEPKF